MKVSIICPVYNGELYIQELNKKIYKQQIVENVEIEIIYALTESKDNSEEILKKIGAKYIKIRKSDFSHSLTREKIALNLETDLIVFISQDIKIDRIDWLDNLIQPIIFGECEASFSKQLCDNNSLEKYTRENNYPSESRIVSKKDIERLGLMTFFYSDASSAIRADLYRKLNAYDNKRLIINEDMYLAEKIISSGNRIKYCAQSEVYHSHTFKLAELFKRYFDTGVFFAQNKQFDGYSGNGNGINMFKTVVQNSFRDKNYKVILRIIPDFATRFIGSFLGKRYIFLPRRLVKKFSSDKGYWEKTL